MFGEAPAMIMIIVLTPECVCGAIRWMVTALSGLGADMGH